MANRAELAAHRAIVVDVGGRDMVALGREDRIRRRKRNRVVKRFALSSIALGMRAWKNGDSRPRTRT
jgi:hypothetical protein